MYAEKHTPAPTMAEQKDMGVILDTTLVSKLQNNFFTFIKFDKLTLKVTCADPRCNPDQFLQTKPQGIYHSNICKRVVV